MKMKTNFWTKNFIFAIISNLFISLIFLLQMTTLTMYATKTFNVSPSLAGLTASIFVIGSPLSRIFAGWKMEAIGRRKLLLIGSVLYVAASMCYFIEAGIGLLLFFRFIHGIAFGILNTTLSTVAMNFIPEDRRGEGIGYFTLSGTLATAVGPFCGSFIMQHYSYNVLFVVCALFAAGSLIMNCLMRIENTGAAAGEPRYETENGFSFRNFFNVKVLPVTFIMFLLCVYYASVPSFINSFAAEKNMADSVSVFFLFYAATILVSRPLSGKLLDRKGDNFIMYPVIVIYGAGMLLLGLAKGDVLLYLSAVLLGLGFGNIISCGMTIAVKGVPAHQVGKTTSTFFLGIDLGIGLGPVLLGLVVPGIGYSGMYLLAAGLTLGTIFLYYTLHGKKARVTNKILNPVELKIHGE